MTKNYGRRAPLFRFPAVRKVDNVAPCGGQVVRDRGPCRWGPRRGSRPHRVAADGQGSAPRTFLTHFRGRDAWDSWMPDVIRSIREDHHGQGIRGGQAGGTSEPRFQTTRGTVGRMRFGDCGGLIRVNS